MYYIGLGDDQLLRKDIAGHVHDEGKLGRLVSATDFPSFDATDLSSPAA